ncbi:CaiB/BaiF CoA transferase family protein [Thermodesulfobacteriota bacterium B35]
MSDTALGHIRVIDLSHHVAGPYCTKLLAGFGAEVIKVERPGTGDPMRSLGPFHQGRKDLERSIPFLWLNTGKQSITLDLKSEKGQEIIRRLVQEADVVVENFSPRVLSSLGLAYDDLRTINPALVMASISNYGQDGPYRDYRADEISLYAMSGLMNETGDPEREPLRAGPDLAQYSAAMCAYAAILSALHRRQATGRGEHLDISIQEAALVNIEMGLVETLQLGQVRKRTGDRHSMMPWQHYECADGEVAVISGPIRHWRRARKIFDEPRLFQSKYDHCLVRRFLRDEYEEILVPCVKQYRKKDLFYAGQEQGLAFAYLATLEEALELPQHRAREFFTEMDHPVVGRHRYCGAPFRMSATPWRSQRAPLLAEHNAEVYGRLLGFTEEEIQAMEEEGIF